jgi:membrane protease YdiL (CAAX protease family)
MAQVSLFLTGIFAVPWGLCFALRPAATQGGLGVLLAWLLPSVWAPTIFALTLTIWSSGAAGVKQEIGRLSFRPGAGRWLVVAAVFPALVTAIAVWSGRAVGDAGPFTAPGGILTMVTLQFVTGAVGEELGWRGFLLPRLSERFGEMWSVWVMAILWSLWHVAGFFFPGTPHYQFIPPVPFLVSVALFGVFLGFIFYRSGGSVLATILAHLSLNLSLGVGGVSLSSRVFWCVPVGIYGAVALLITLKLRLADTDSRKNA